ncbi:MAG: dihydrofolate synthase / folylpolyglutamate synthase [Candidatus Tokpelaia sp. JSC188]|nr:MAG: dihydrofolate synthase / folylpolyglutamate synthase [Candidatus Tokpelaia sp. JSC188]
MAKTEEQHIEDLLKFHPQIIDLSLKRIRRLLADLDNPHLKIPPVIHIAGTNGKGSASAFSRAILEAAGYRVHVYTSPHLVHWRERYRIGYSDGGQFVTDKKLADTIVRVSAANRKKSITVFEILTATAFLLFSEYPADATIIEVGLGGRFDATNVIEKPAVSLIMPISLDHQSFLGKCVEDIAVEKAGIIKNRKPVVIGFQDSEIIRNILVNKALEMKAPVSVYGQDYTACEELGYMVFQNRNGSINLPLPRLSGSFQISNAAAAIEGISIAGFQIKDLAFAHAMNSVSWPARMQKLQYGKLVDLLPADTELWLDSGHNPAAAVITAQAASQICETKRKKLVLICGMLNTKDATCYLSAFKDIAAYVYTVPVHFNKNGIPAEKLAKVACRNGLNARSSNSVFEILADIRNIPKTIEPFLILICGSIYLAGEILRENGIPPQ